MKNKITYLLLLILFSFTVHAQSIKYDDLYEELHTLKPTHGLFKLLSYQKQEPYFVNTYLQIGNICEKQLETIDPLRDIDQAIFWANNASLYYKIYPKFASKGEVNRNKEFLTNLGIPYAGKKLTDEEVISYVSNRLEYYDSYKKETSLIYNTLEKSKEHYNNAIQLFTELNNDYESLNELLLHTNDSLLLIIDSMHFEYEYFSNNFDSYKKLIADYPISSYNQNYSLKIIETYRLDGLTSSDFLQNEFMIWDYDYWVKNYITTYKNDILTLREEISTIQQGYIDNKNLLDATDTISSEEKFSSYDELFFFKLGRYDSYSLIKDLFKYHDIRQKFFVYGNSPMSNADDSSIALLNTKLRYFFNLTILKKAVLQELNLLEKNITKEKTGRFEQFFSDFYDGNEGLMDFTENEPHVLYETMETDFAKLKSYYINQDALKDSMGYIPYKKDSLAIFVNNTNNDSINQTIKYLTKHIQYAQGKPTFISGRIKTKSKKQPFIARINADTTVSWIKTIKADSIEGNQCINKIYSYTSGMSTIITSEKSSKSSLLVFNTLGEKIFEKPIQDTLTPCLLKYDEITQNYFYVMGSKDTSLLDTSYSNPIYNTFHIYFTDSVGTEIWSNTLSINGEFVDAKRNGNNIQAFVNSLNDQNKWELAITQIDSVGVAQQTFTIPAVESYAIKQTFNASSTSINLVGFFGKNPDDWSGKLVYLIIDEKGNLSYDNLPN